MTGVLITTFLLLGAPGLLPTALPQEGAAKADGDGIGGTVTVLTLLDAVFWRPLPVKEPDSLVLLNRQTPGEPFYWHISYPDFRELERRNQIFEELAGSGFDSVGLEIEARSSERVVAQLATATRSPLWASCRRNSTA